MLFFAFVCIFLAFAKGEVRLCSTPVDLVCNQPDPNILKELPGNTEELRLFCSSTNDYVECLRSYDLACAGRSRFIGLQPPLYYHRIANFLDNACEPDNALHKTLGKDLWCIKGRVSNRKNVCKKTNRKILEAYEEYLVNHPIRGHAKVLRTECLELVATAACILEDIEDECGFLAYEAANNSITSSQILAYKCELDIFQELKGVVSHLKIDNNVKNSLKKYFVVEIE